MKITAWAFARDQKRQRSFDFWMAYMRGSAHICQNASFRLIAIAAAWIAILTIPATQIAARERTTPTAAAQTKAMTEAEQERARAKDCARAVTEFVAELDKELSKFSVSNDVLNNDVRRFEALFPKHLFPDRNWIDGDPDRPRLGCNIEEVIEIAKRSKYFVDTREGRDWRQQDYTGILFENWRYRVGFLLNVETRAMAEPRAWINRPWRDWWLGKK